MLDQLFSPISLGSLRLSNRVVMPPMITRFANTDGYVSDHSIAYYRERAAGGTGLIIFEGTYPCERHPKRHLLVDDSYIPGLTRLVDTVHAENARVAVQLNIHRGIADQVNPLSPSEMTMPDGQHIPAVSVSELEALIDDFAAGADRARRAGFDGIEIHACSGYLVQMFLSQRTNNRTDAYGGSLRARTKLARDLLDAVRDRVGDDFPVWFRIPGDEFLEGGITIADAKQIASHLEHAGSDALHVTAGHFLNAGHVMLTGRSDRGAYADYAAAVKSVVDFPVITVGRINDPVTAEELLVSGKADLIAMGRAHLADPHFVSKAQAGDLDRIRHCVGGLEGCRDLANGSISCTVNPALGNEATWAKYGADGNSGDAKHVLVVGGGPSGMEAARVCARRGHTVTLVEQHSSLGGQLRYAKHAPAKREYETLITFYERELDALGVTVELGDPLGPDDVAAYHANEVIVAVGAVPDVPNIDGISAAIQQGVVVPAETVLTAAEPEPGMSVVIGGSDTAFDVAEYRSTHGYATTIVSADEVLPLRGASAGELSTRPYILELFEEDPSVDVLSDHRVSSITDSGVTVRGGGREHLIDCSRVVLAELTPEVTFRQAIDEPSVRVIGDAGGVRGLHTAIHEGAEVARSISPAR